MRAPRVKIVFEDTHLAVISKPAGLLSQGEKTGDENLVDQLRDYLGRHYVGLIHRLDRNTSGLMVVAKRSKSAARLSAALQDGSLKRRYQAWLCGLLAGPVQWRHWLMKDAQKNQVRAFGQKTAAAKEAVLQVQPIRTLERLGQDYTLAEFTLQTGRSHQIRVQSAYERLPLAGDVKYGRKPGQDGIARPALHSSYLEFPHPMSGAVLCYDEPVPEDMRW